MKREEWLLIKSKNTQYFQSSLFLKNEFKHAFFTKNCKYKDSRKLSLEAYGITNMHFLDQIHSNKVNIASELSSNGNAKGDSIVSNKKNQGLWIYSADCIPILFADRKTGRVAACHAGWRGLEKGIIRNTINMFAKLGSNRINIIVALGPAISGANYSLKLPILKAICKSIKSYQELKEEELEAIIKVSNSIDFIEKKKGLDGFAIDLRTIALIQLLDEGIKKDSISINKLCTFSESKLLHSWRRDKVKCSQWSSIVSS